MTKNSAQTESVSCHSWRCWWLRCNMISNSDISLIYSASQHTCERVGVGRQVDLWCLSVLCTCERAGVGRQVDLWCLSVLCTCEQTGVGRQVDLWARGVSESGGQHVLPGRDPAGTAQPRGTLLPGRWRDSRGKTGKTCSEVRKFASLVRDWHFQLTYLLTADLMHCIAVYSTVE